MEFKLYSYFRSSSSYRVRIALNYKQIPYEYIPVHLLDQGGHQNKLEYLKINPKQEVPTLVHNGNFISQSVAIIEYLDELKPENKLFPDDLIAKAEVRQICEIINSGIQPLQNLRILKKLINDFGISEGQKIKWIKDVISSGLAALEINLTKTSGTFCIANHITAADLFLIPQIYNAERYEMDMRPYPNIMKVNTNCMKIESFRKAHPDFQPDAPKS